MSCDAFISYATPDRDVALALVDNLEVQGINCWIAPRDVPGGAKYAEVILGALSEAKLFLLVFSEHSNGSEHVQREVERALNLSKTIVPVRIADLYPTGAMDYYLATLHWIDAFGATTESGMEQAARGVAERLGRPWEDLTLEAEEAVGASAEAMAAPPVELPVASPATPAPAAASAGEDRDAKSATPAGSKKLIASVAALAIALAVGGFAYWKMRPVAPPVGPPPADLVAEAVVAAGEAWAKEDVAATISAWNPILSLEEGELTTDRLGETGLGQLRELVARATSDAGSQDRSALAELESWRPLVDLSARLGIDDLAPQSKRFESYMHIVNAEEQWATGRREPAAQTLAALAMQKSALAGDDGSPAVERLNALLGDVVAEASKGQLGSLQSLTESWLPALEMAGEAGNLEAISLMATLAWDVKDYPAAAARLSQYDEATRGKADLGPMVEDLLKKVLRAAQAGEVELRKEAWEPAYNLAYSHELPGSLLVLAQVIHGRDPGEAAPLFRQWFKEEASSASAIQRIKLCNEMIGRYDFGAEGDYYRKEAQQACEDALQKSSGERTEAEEVAEIGRMAAHGVTGAQHLMADLLFSGEGVEKNLAEAFGLYKQAAEAGYVRSKFALASCYHYANGTDRDLAEAARLYGAFTESEFREMPEAMFNLAQLTTEDPDEQTRLFGEARKYYREKLETDAGAGYKAALGSMLLNGQGGEPEPKEAFRLLMEAANADEYMAQAVVGSVLYNEGPELDALRKEIGIERDEKGGLDLIKRAARSGYEPAIKWCEQNGVAPEE